jgi:acetyl-CoA carboxylase carboxyl transferase subunit alpha
MSRPTFVMEFERPLFDLEDKLRKLKELDISVESDLGAEIASLETEIELLKETLYTGLTAWEKVQVARHPDRPRTQDYVSALFRDVFELRGDRAFADDGAVMAALATLDERRLVVVGHRKGRTTKENLQANFGMARPEGFRKARRVMRLAERFDLPVVAFVDTPGAHAGADAEERGQALAIAQNLAFLARLRVPVIAIGIGEGGSGGALALGYGDRLVMLENAYYSVSTPEACASILLNDAGRAAEMAAGLRLTADDLLDLGLVDAIVPEPMGGAHRDPGAVYGPVAGAIVGALEQLEDVSPDELVTQRYERLRAFGQFAEAPETADEPA